MAQNNLPTSLALYVPENFDIDKMIKENPPDFPYHKDEFLYLVHLISDIPLRNKDEDMDFIPLQSTILQRKVRNYNKYLAYLVKHEVLLADKQYIKGKKSKSFKFHRKHVVSLKAVKVTNKTLIKNVLKFHGNEREIFLDSHIEDFDYLIKWFGENLTIDYQAAEKYLLDLYLLERKSIQITKDEAKRKFYLRKLVILKLRRQEFLCIVDKTAGRLHTVLSQLKGELRQFVRFKTQKLVAVDITNSQPYLSSVLLNPDIFTKTNMLSTIKLYNKYLKDEILILAIQQCSKSEDVIQYLSWVKSGRLYEEFGEILEKKGLIQGVEFCGKTIREQAKKIVFGAFFSPNQSIAYNKAMVIFKDCFPGVYKIFSLIKSREHRTLACALQNLEAKLVLEQACYIISQKHPKIPLFTLHDSIITTEGNEKKVKDVLLKVLVENIGFEPQLKIEKWEKVV